MPTLMAAGDPLSFYSTAAGIIPVIVLALAFQFGTAGFRFIPEQILEHDVTVERREERDFWIAVYSLFMLAVLIVGEVIALLIIATGRPQPWWGAAVAVALVAGAAGLVIPIVIAHVSVIRAGRQATRRRGAMRRAVIALVGVTGVAALAAVGYAVLAPSRVIVPPVVGARSVFAAEGVLSQAGLRLAPVIQEAVNRRVRPGTVVSQQPNAGTSVKHGAAVSLAVAVRR